MLWQARTGVSALRAGKGPIMAVYKRNDVWWIDYYVNGRRKRERIGTNYKLAQQILAKRKVQIAEGKYLEKRQESNLRLDKLIELYMEHTKDKKRSHKRDITSTKKIVEFFKMKTIAAISPYMIEEYIAQRKRSTNQHGRSPKPATINRELAFLKRVFSWGIENKMISSNPAKYTKLLKENNIRDRVLTAQEFERLLAACPQHLQPIVLTAYYTGMRLGEILGLTWDRMDLSKGFIILTPELTKTNEGRLVPLHQRVIDELSKQKRIKGIAHVFTYRGQPITVIRKGFTKACADAGISDFRFHDLRHCAVTNWIRQGHDYFKIMVATGHKTMSVFKRYHTVSEDDLKGLVRG